MNLDLKQRVDQGPMGSFQCLAIGICIVLNMIDGFDVLVMAFTAARCCLLYTSDAADE